MATNKRTVAPATWIATSELDREYMLVETESERVIVSDLSDTVNDAELMDLLHYIDVTMPDGRIVPAFYVRGDVAHDDDLENLVDEIHEELAYLVEDARGEFGG